MPKNKIWVTISSPKLVFYPNFDYFAITFEPEMLESQLR